jgi:16S rRNA (cytidine1402-2'-O)-methyltransferase
VTGILHIVATPIGNLEDMTFRAVRVLREASRIACEDTRHTRRLLDHYGIDRPLVSYHEHNERERTSEILDWVRSGERIALVSDAGTPLISDPGYRVVEAAVREGLRVEPVPGACAFVAALSASGLPTDAFYFAGFLPGKASARRKALENLSALRCVLVFYEAPHRLGETLADVAAVFGERRVVVAREVTKLHEEWFRGTALASFGHFAGRAVKGEITFMIDKPGDPPLADLGSFRQIFNRYLESGMSKMDAMKATARECGVSKRDVWAELQKDE